MVRKSAFVVVIAAAVALFATLIGLSPVGAQNTTPTVQLGSSADLGSFLVDSQGMTLYVYANDTPGVSNCTLAAWASSNARTTAPIRSSITVCRCIPLPATRSQAIRQVRV
jgi:predicted lipoprotein with Yx(FWY)xxD motif